MRLVSFTEPKDLIGKNIGTSFVHLAQQFFAKLEQEQDQALETLPNGTDPQPFRPVVAKAVDEGLAGRV